MQNIHECYPIKKQEREKSHTKAHCQISSYSSDFKFLEKKKTNKQCYLLPASESHLLVIL